MSRSPKEVDVGSGFSYRTFTEAGADGPTGLLIEGPAGPDCPYRGTDKRRREYRRCGGGVNFESSTIAAKEGRPRWKVLSLEPLSLQPSIACKCRFQHGFITDGRYVPA